MRQSALEPYSEGILFIERGHRTVSFGKIMMFWFMSPLEAARASLEAQRQIAFFFLRLPSGQQRREEVISGGGKAASVELPKPARSIAAARRKSAAVHKAIGPTKSRRKGKSRRK
jgi:hypothetical protein